MSDVKTINDKVAEVIASATDEIRQRVVAAEAEKEIASRAQAISDAYHTIDRLRKEYARIDRPDVGTEARYDRDGKQLPVEGTYSKARLEALKKGGELIEKWEDALKKAWGDETTLPDFKKLRELLKNGSPKIEAGKPEKAEGA